MQDLSIPKLSPRARAISRIKRKILARHLWIARVGFLVGLAIALILMGLVASWIVRNSPLQRYFSLAYSFIATPKQDIASIDNRTNVLILGKAGKGNTAPDLTDTIMVASVGHNNPEIILISVPRDIWVADLRAKLNSAYYWGNQKQEGGGLILAKSSVEEIVGVPIHYVLVVDFSGFVEIVDVLGGVDVDVERSFVDERYPIAGRENDECDGDPEYLCRYETVEFNAGMQNMNGETSLKYVRSRNSGDLEEGTDLARSQRQQRLLAAIRKKTLSEEILFSPKKLGELWDLSEEIIETDIPDPAAAVLARRGLQAQDKIVSRTIPEELIVNPPQSPLYDNLYVFIPSAKDWSEVHSWVKDVF